MHNYALLLTFICALALALIPRPRVGTRLFSGVSKSCSCIINTINIANVVVGHDWIEVININFGKPKYIIYLFCESAIHYRRKMKQIHACLCMRTVRSPSVLHVPLV